MLLLLLTSFALTGQAGPEIVDPRSTFGHHGAARPKPEGLLPGDVAAFSFGIKNLKIDENGLSKYSVAIEIRDSKGNLFYEQKPFNAVAQHAFGGDTIPASATVSIPLKQPSTELNWKVVVKDRLTDKSTELKGSGKVLPADFGLVRIGTYADPEGRVPLAPTGVIGGTVFLNFAAVGYGKKENKPEIDVELKVLDDSGKPTMPKSLTAKIREEDEGDHLIPLHYGLTLNRPGRYNIEVTARDAIGNKTTTFTLPVRILPMD